jgi:spermidine/putrescine-binding protein
MRRILSVFFASVLILSCSKNQGRIGSEELNLYIWSNYIPAESLKKFEKDTGIKVNFDTYDGNEVLIEKLQSGVMNYDVVVPSDYATQILIKQNLLDTLDLSQIPNLKNINPQFRNLPHDPNNTFTVPLFWGTSGIAYRKDKIRNPVRSWALLFDERYQNRILMLDDMRECFGAALKWRGQSINSTNTAELQDAKALLLKQNELLRQYNSSNFDEAILSGDVWIAHGWSGQLAKAADHDTNIVYFIPLEGSVIWVDNFAIPRGARHKDAAHRFINFFLEGRMSGEITTFSGYGTPNDSAKPYIPSKQLNDPARYPSKEILDKCEFLKDIGETTQVLDKYWTEIKSR